MEIKQTGNDKKGAFFVEGKNKNLAEMTYVWANTDRIIIDHTEVDDELAGKGVGKMMVRKAVEFARHRNIKIIPLCPFAKSVFDKVEEFGDVLAKK